MSRKTYTVGSIWRALVRGWKRDPYIRLRGLWLAENGFGEGAKFEVVVLGPGRIELVATSAVHVVAGQKRPEPTPAPCPDHLKY